MREIKFRAKDLKKNWLYGYYVQHGGTSFIVGEDGVSHIANGDTLGQFTGVKDKNGKEIYEGDIVRYAPWGKVGPVCFHRNTWFLPDEHIERVPFEDEDYEVLGNIHDNPELLED